MLFNLNIELNESDYLNFNKFHSFKSKHGKKMLRKSRLSLLIVMVFLIALIFLLRGWTIFSVVYSLLLLLFHLLYMLFFKALMVWTMKIQIKRMKKMGKLPFDPISSFEFHEDKMIEFTTSKRTEQGYDTFEQICVVKDHYIFMYTNSIAAYILPMAQINAQLNQEDFIAFLTEKCSNVEYY